MRIYVVLTPTQTLFRGTLDNAHRTAKEHAASHDWRDIRIEEREYEVDKKGILAILNNGDTPTTLRTYEFKSARLGLEVADCGCDDRNCQHHCNPPGADE